MRASRLLEAWNSLEAYRQQAEGDPASGALVGAILGAFMEGGRLAAHLVQGAEDKLKAIEARIERIRTSPSAILITNLRRQASSTPSITNIQSDLAGGGGSVTKLASSTSTDQAGRIRVINGTNVVDADEVLARINFSTPFSESPLILLGQESGTDAGLVPANVTTTGFDVVTGAGLDDAATLNFVYLAIATTVTVPVA